MMILDWKCRAVFFRLNPSRKCRIWMKIWYRHCCAGLCRFGLLNKYAAFRFFGGNIVIGPKGNNCGHGVYD